MQVMENTVIEVLATVQVMENTVIEVLATVQVMENTVIEVLATVQVMENTMIEVLAAVQVMENTVIERLQTLIDWMLPACLKFVRSSIKEVVPTLDAGLVRSCMRLLETLLNTSALGADQRAANLKPNL